MTNSQSIFNIIILVMVGVGILLLFKSTNISRKVQSIVPTEYAIRWRILTLLMYSFIAGYIAYIVIILTGWLFPLGLLIACVFIGGAVFVYGIIDLARSTINSLHENAETLERRIDERTDKLVQSNLMLEKSQKSLHDKNEFLQNVLEALTHPFYVIDVKNYKIVMHNSAAGFEGKTGETCYHLTHDSEKPCTGEDHPCTIKEIGRTGRPVVLEHTHKDQHGKDLFVEVRAYPIFDETGKLSQVIEYVQDITKRKVSEQNLIKAKFEAETANKAKNEFLANVSHEIRTPMNAILGMTDLALATELTTAQRSYLETVKGSSDLLLNLINDILDFSKIEAGKFQLDSRPFTVSNVMSTIIPTMSHVAEEKGLVLTTDCQDELCEHILVGDDLRLRQVLNNLIGNAIKFTDSGSVKVLCGCRKLSSEVMEIECSVTDTGIGIEKAYFKQIFESFSQVDSAISKNHGGTGLGLAISKLLIELMGGEIRVKSGVGKGSVFVFNAKFPIDDRPQEHAKSVSDKEAVVELNPKKILVVDDISPNRDLVRMILEQDGHTIDEAGSGVEALAKIAENTYDIVLLDVQMPIMDGLQTARNIRRCEKEEDCLPPDSPHIEVFRKLHSKHKGKHLPLVALTARATTDDREKCFAAGMDAYLSKPFRKEEIIWGMYQATQNV